jgi:hypothetical protein
VVTLLSILVVTADLHVGQHPDEVIYTASRGLVLLMMILGVMMLAIGGLVIWFRRGRPGYMRDLAGVITAFMGAVICVLGLMASRDRVRVSPSEVKIRTAFQHHTMPMRKIARIETYRTRRTQHYVFIMTNADEHDFVNPLLDQALPLIQAYRQRAQLPEP